MRLWITSALIIIVFANEGCNYDKPLLPLANCDTSIVTFSGTIKPIITANCIRCHIGPDALNANGIVIDDYVSLKKQVPQPLLDAILHTGNVTPMPQDGGMLDACTIAKIKIWIAAGAPNN